MQIIGSNNPSKYIKGTTDADDFSLSAQDIGTVTSSNPLVTNYTDGTVTSFNSIVANNFRLLINKSLANSRVVSVTNNSPTKCAVDTQLNVVSKNGASGDVSISVNLAGVGTRTLIRTIAQITLSKPIAISFTAGSLRRHLLDNINTLIAGKTPTQTYREVFTNGLLNANAFCSALDFTGVQYQASTGAAVLISKRHAICCAHAHGNLVVGAQVEFRNKAGIQTQTVTVVRSQAVSGARDLYIAYFNADVTVATPFKILPANVTTYLPDDSPTAYAIQRQNRLGDNDYIINYSVMGVEGFSTPNFYAGKPDFSNKQTAIFDLAHPILNADGSTSYNYIDPQIASSDPLNAWGSVLIGNDSGSPMFIALKEANNAGNPIIPVLLGVTVTGDFGACNLAQIVPTLNTTMNAMRDVGDSFNYTISVVNLAGFTTY